MDPAEELAARLRENPADQQAYESLKEIYRSRGDHASLVNLIAGWAGWSPDDGAASRAYLEVGDLLYHELRDAPQAEAFYRESLARDGTNLDASEALQALLEAGEDWQKLTDFLQEQVQTLPALGAPPSDLAVLRYRLGELWSKQFDSIDEALHHYRRAFEQDPTMVRAIYEARELMIGQGDLRGAADLYDREVTAEPDAARKVALLIELATLYRDRIGDMDGAVSALQRARTLVPDDAELTYELATLLAKRAEGLDDRTAHADYSQVADLLCEIAAGLPPDEAKSYLISALGYAPDHEGALAELERLLEGTEAAAELAGHWVAYLGAAPAGRGAHRRRVQLARAYVSGGQLEDAAFALEPAAQAGHRPAEELLAEIRAQLPDATEQDLPPVADAEEPPPTPPVTEDDPNAEPEEIEVESGAEGAQDPPPATSVQDTLELRGRRQREEEEPEPRPRSSRSTAPDPHNRDTTDFDDVKTTVGEMPLIEALREEAAGAQEGPTSPAGGSKHPRTDTVEPEGPADEAEEVVDLDELDAVEEETATGMDVPPAAAASTAPPPAEADEPEPEPEPPPSVDDLGAWRAEAGALARERRNDEAALLWQRVFEAASEDREAFAFLDGYYRRKQRHGERAALLLASAASEDLPKRTRLTRLREAASVYEARVRDAQGAVRAWRGVMELEPDSPDAIRAIKRLLERAGLWDELADVLELELSQAADGEAQMPLLRRIATIHRDKREDLAAAASTLERVLEIKPGDRSARDALIGDLLTLERFEDAVGMLEAKVEETRAKSQKLPLLHQIADIYSERLVDADRAFATLEAIIKLAPKKSEVLERMVALDERAGNHERLLSTLDRQAVAAEGEVAAPIYARMASIAERQLQDIDRASDLLSRAVDLAPHNRGYLQALCALYERDDRYEDLVELLRERSVMEKAEDVRVELYRRIATLLGEHLSDAEGAADTWRALLDLREDKEALSALQQVALEGDDAEALADILGRLATLEANPEDKRDLLFERAQLLTRRLSRPGDAVADLVKLLTTIDPAFDPALDELTEACGEAGDHRGLAEVLEARLSAAQEPDARIDYATRLAELYENDLRDPPRAIRALHKWSEAEPVNAEPHRRLCPLLKSKRRNKELLVSLDALSQLEHDQEERDERTIEAAALASEQFDDIDGAWARLVPLVERTHPQAETAIIALAHRSARLDPLYDLLERTEHIDSLLKLLRERVGAEPDAPTRAILHRRIAHLLVDYRQDEDGAADAYAKLLEIQEDVDALRFVQAVAVRRDDPETLSDALRRLAALEQDVEEKRDLLYEHARLLNARLEQHPEAIAVLVPLTIEHPDFEPATDELLSACEAAGDHASLADTLERLLGHTSDPTTRTELAARLADVCEMDLEDATRSASALRMWSEADTGSPEPRRRLRPLLARLDDEASHIELLGVLDALARLEPEAEPQLEATIAAAKLARGKLGDTDGAWQRLTPHVADAHPGVDETLTQLAIDSGRLDELYRLLEQADRYDALVELMRDRVSEENDADLKVELYRRIAQLTHNQLDDEEGAHGAWLELLDLREDAEALLFLRSRSLRRDDMNGLANALKRLAALQDEHEDRRDLLFEYARLLNTRLGRAAEAIPILSELLEQHDPEFEPAIDELISACESVGDQGMLASTLERVLEREKDDQNRVDLLRRLAELYEGPLEDAKRAVERYEAWVAVAPSDAEPHRALVPLLTDMQRPASLLLHYDALSELEPDEGDRREARLSAAELCIEQLEDPDGAWRRASPLLAPGDARATDLLSRVAFKHDKLQELVELYAQHGRHDDVVTLLREEAEQSEDRAQRGELYRRCARILGGPLEDELAAAEAWREVLDAGEDVEALEFLRKIATRIDEPDELAELLGRLANQLPDPSEKREVLFERALLLGDRLERPKEAVDVLRYIVTDLDPTFAPAIEELIAGTEALRDPAGLADALELQLATLTDGAARIETASRMADLYEEQLEDSSRAAAALKAWTAVDSRNPDPQRRLRPYLEKAGHPEELLTNLDALAAYEESEPARTEAAFAAAHLVFNKLGDAEGAWKRLAPLVLGGDERAELEAHELAKRAKLERALANLYVMRAQKAKDPQASSRDWMNAAKVYDEYLGEAGEALEASLRSLASDMKNRNLLYDIDRLSIAAGAWDRLWRVYTRLVEDTFDREEKIELLTRHADLLQKHGADPAAALERVLQICKLDPEREEALTRAEALATEADSDSELLWIYENLYKSADSDERRAYYLLRAARVSDHGLKDREQAVMNLTRALALTEELPQVAGEIEDLARELDRSRPELGEDDARRALIRAHMELAPDMGEPYGPMLVLRASQLLKDELNDAPACFDALKQGAGLFPNDMVIYDALEEAGLKIKRLDALDAHLARSSQRATDPEVKLGLLERRARLNAAHLERPAKAAEAYREMLALDPRHEEANTGLLSALRKAGRYQDLLRAFNERLERTSDTDARVELLRQIAGLWEVELKNRPSAIETWRQVQELAPEDGEASAALSRLQRTA